MARPDAGPAPVGTSAVAPRDVTKRRDLQAYIEISKMLERDDRRADLRAMLGSDDVVERFVAVALSAIANDSDLLLNATPASIIQAVKDSATLGLEPTGLTGEGAIVRYGQIAKFMPMYRGYLKRIRNTGKVLSVTAEVVYEHDKFEYGYGEKGGWFTHTPVIPTSKTGLDESGEPERGDYLGAYAYARFPDGYVEFRYMPAVEINDIRDKYSKAGKGSPWDMRWPEMAKKTVIRNLAKYLPQRSDELALAVNELLAADAAADEAKDEASEGAKRLDVSKARSAALAAAARRGAPQLASGAEEPADDVSVDPSGAEDVDEPPFPI